MSGEQFNEDYFLRGKETGKSLYEDYRWLPDLTIPMVCAMIRHLGIQPTDTVLDYGCARGYVVRAFRELGYNAWGYDVSRWAVENCDEVVRPYLSNVGFSGRYDWVIAKDVLEHVEDANRAIASIKEVVGKGIFAVVPLASRCGTYDVPEYELDVTHIHRQPLWWWVQELCAPGWSVEARYRCKGVKDNYAHYPRGNGFITARRIE